MAKMRFSKKRLMLIGGSVLLLACVVGAVVLLTNHHKNAVKPPAAVNPDSVKKNLVVGDVQIPDVANITAQYPDPTLRYNKLVEDGGIKLQFSKYDEALMYYKAAAAVQGISDQQRDSANLRVYYIAKKTSDGVLIAQYETLLGDKIPQALKESTNNGQ